MRIHLHILELKNQQQYKQQQYKQQQYKQQSKVYILFFFQKRNTEEKCSKPLERETTGT